MRTVYELAAFVAIFFVMVFMASFGTCSSEVETVPFLPKSRIISLTPASTEILFALGLDKEIIGVSSFCSWPDAAKAKEKVGSFSSPDIERIILLKPDLVILTGMEQESFKSVLTSLKIDHVVVDPPDLDGLITSIRTIGSMTGTDARAHDLAQGLKKSIEETKKACAALQGQARPKVYVEIWHDPVMSVGESSFISDMIETAGGINIAKGLKRGYSRIDPEKIIYENPDIIIIAYMKPLEWIQKTFSSRTGWRNISAVKNGKIYSDIDPDTILRPGPRVAQGLEKLYARFHEK